MIDAAKQWLVEAYDDVAGEMVHDTVARIMVGFTEARTAELERRLAEAEALRTAIHSAVNESDEGYAMVGYPGADDTQPLQVEPIDEVYLRDRERADQAEHERDEALAEKFSSKPPRQWQEKVEHAERERDEAEERIEIACCTQAAIERERDEARAEVGRLKNTTKERYRLRALRMEKERDRYRADADRYDAEAARLREKHMRDIGSLRVCQTIKAQRDRALGLLKDAHRYTECLALCAAVEGLPEDCDCGRVDMDERLAALLEYLK